MPKGIRWGGFDGEHMLPTVVIAVRSAATVSSSKISYFLLKSPIFLHRRHTCYPLIGITTVEHMALSRHAPCLAHHKKTPAAFQLPGFQILERETGFEPATSTLARSHSTTELFPRNELLYITDDLICVNIFFRSYSSRTARN